MKARYIYVQKLHSVYWHRKCSLQNLLLHTGLTNSANHWSDVFQNTSML